MSAETEVVVGALVSLTQPEEGETTWVATQTPNVQRLLPPGDVKGRYEIDWSLGPISVTGYLDTDTFGVGLSVAVVGITVGNIYGNLKDGVGLKVDLFVAKGSILFSLKNDNEVWVHLDLSITFDGSYSGDYKIFSF